MGLSQLTAPAALAALSCLAVLCPANDAFAGGRTDVVDAFAPGNPFDFHIEPSFRQHIERSTIVREAPGTLQRTGCDGDSNEARCNEAATEIQRELDYRRVLSALDIDLQFGLHRNLEFHVTLPIIISDTRTLEFADGVGPDNSTVDPANDRINSDLNSSSSRDEFTTYRFFEIPSDGKRRSGFGDLVVGFSYAPLDQERNPATSNLRLTLDYQLPSGRVARGDNNGVGTGVHEIRFSMAASRVYREVVEPYFEFGAVLPIAGGNSLFAGRNNNSINQAPGARFDAAIGNEFILFDDPNSGQRYSVSLGLDMGYTIQGRDYSPLFDALAGSSCNGLTAAEAGFPNGTTGNAYRPDPTIDPNNAACAWVVQQPGNVLDDTLGDRSQWAYAHDGITDIEGHARIGGHAGVDLQFSPYVAFRLGAILRWESPHFLNFADAGRDANQSGVVELSPVAEDGESLERNPNYNLTMDPVGRRFRVENSLTIDWNATLAFQF